MVKKRGAKRRPWNKGLEVGKKGAFVVVVDIHPPNAPAIKAAKQPKRICA